MPKRLLPKAATLAGAALLTVGFLVPLADAQPPGNAGNAKHGNPHKVQKEHSHGDLSDGLRPSERDLIVDIIRKFAGLEDGGGSTGGLPPGLAKRGQLPPGLQRQLDGAFPDKSFRFTDAGLQVRDKQTGAILGIIENVLILGGTL